jgi:hypothetical protein
VGNDIVMLPLWGRACNQTRRRVFRLEIYHNTTSDSKHNSYPKHTCTLPYSTSQKCSINANAPRTSSPRQPPHSPATTTPAQSKPSTHTPNPSSHLSTPTNLPLSNQIHLHTSTSARENATATIALTPNLSQHPRFSGYTRHSAKT